MKTLQVSMENRVGCTLRGIVTLPETNEPVPFVLNLHGFAGSASGYKYLHTHLARMLADHGVGCARFDFYGCGESDGEFSDMTFDGLHSDAADLYAWVRAQPYVDCRDLHRIPLMWIHGVYSFPGRAWEVMWRPASRRVCGRTG